MALNCLDLCWEENDKQKDEVGGSLELESPQALGEVQEGLLLTIGVALATLSFVCVEHLQRVSLILSSWHTSTAHLWVNVPWLVVRPVWKFLERRLHQIPAADFTRFVILVGNLKNVWLGLVRVGNHPPALHPCLRCATTTNLNTINVTNYLREIDQGHKL